MGLLELICNGDGHFNMPSTYNGNGKKLLIYARERNVMCSHSLALFRSHSCADSHELRTDWLFVVMEPLLHFVSDTPYAGVAVVVCVDVAVVVCCPLPLLRANKVK